MGWPPWWRPLVSGWTREFRGRVWKLPTHWLGKYLITSALPGPGLSFGLLVSETLK